MYVLLLSAGWFLKGLLGGNNIKGTLVVQVREEFSNKNI